MHLLPIGLAAHAAVLGKAGRIADALVPLRETIELADRLSLRYSEAESYRLTGELLLAENATNTEAAERSFRRAIEIARGQKALSLELRAVAGLARLLGIRGSRDEACSMLADVRGRFTGVLRTPDLEDADALLALLHAERSVK
jgi:hypothetical protein